MSDSRFEQRLNVPIERRPDTGLVGLDRRHRGCRLDRRTKLPVAGEAVTRLGRLAQWRRAGDTARRCAYRQSRLPTMTNYSRFGSGRGADVCPQLDVKRTPLMSEGRLRHAARVSAIRASFVGMNPE